MTVARILMGKGRSVATVRRDDTIAAAARELSLRKIGALVVVENDKVVGILSERDIVRSIGVEGPGVLDQKVERHMTSKVVTCVETQSVRDVMGIMTAGRFRHVPVVREGRLDGIISIGDVVKHRLDELESEQQAMRDYIAQTA
jgi:CBS domain-containing protein